MPRVEGPCLEGSQVLRVQRMQDGVRWVWDAPALGARGAAPQVWGARGPLWVVILSRPLHTQEPCNPLQQDELHLEREKETHQMFLLFVGYHTKIMYTFLCLFLRFQPAI